MGTIGSGEACDCLEFVSKITALSERVPNAKQIWNLATPADDVIAPSAMRYVIEMSLKLFLGLAMRIRRHESVLSLELRAHLIGLVYCHWIGSSVVHDSLLSWIS